MNRNSAHPVFKPLLPRTRKVAPLLKRIDSSRTYSNFGPISLEYRLKLAEYLRVDADTVVLTSSATQGLQGLVALLGLPTWRVPDFSFAAPALAARNAGSKLEFRDVSAEDWMLTRTPHRLSNVGQLVVLPFGRKIGKSSIEREDNTIIDAAASMGEVEAGFEWLRSSSAACFSLHATKVLPAGEGGVVVCGSKEMALELTKWTNFGFENRVSVVAGTNAKMSEMTAAYGLTSLIHAQKELQEWRAMRSQVNELIKEAGIPRNVLNDMDLYGANPYWMVKFGSASQLRHAARKLGDHGFESRKWWPEPLSKMPALRTSNLQSRRPISQSLSETVLGLPFFRGIRLSALQKIAEIVGASVDSKN